ncbi:uncharacterized protein KY384_004785 [Bacidia gigantensis]|uniref:uncharacterized protein n=1 Tax=Bacidia gigantensis TaxID=2732470 RepID=UPI001D04A113|nr:uncharacterized protein KY384_004785 [Bacidia gigantensis]KAG8530283.1 hypothetical protein KY384_004785 [Bacidia gigantensis]
MRSTPTFAVIFFVSSTVLSQYSNHVARPVTRSLDAILVDPQEAEAQSPAHPFSRSLNLRNAISSIPYIKHLDLRQVAPAANAQANANANTNANAAAQAQQPANAAAGTVPQQVAPVPAANNAPVAGVGGGGAPAQAQPAANVGQANPVTVITVATVVGGVTKQVPQTFTQSAGAGGSAPPVQTGTIGMGTLTGKVGVVKTDSAKSDGVPLREYTSKRWTAFGIMGSWTMAMLLCGAMLGARII